eukprot:358102-Pelagomonas_calceolata.AAC.1
MFFLNISLTGKGDKATQKAYARFAGGVYQEEEEEEEEEEDWRGSKLLVGLFTHKLMHIYIGGLLTGGMLRHVNALGLGSGQHSMCLSQDLPEKRVRISSSRLNQWHHKIDDPDPARVTMA